MYHLGSVLNTLQTGLRFLSRVFLARNYTTRSFFCDVNLYFSRLYPDLNIWSMLFHLCLIFFHIAAVNTREYVVIFVL